MNQLDCLLARLKPGLSSELGKQAPNQSSALQGLASYITLFETPIHVDGQAFTRPAVHYRVHAQLAYVDLELEPMSTLRSITEPIPTKA